MKAITPLQFIKLLPRNTLIQVIYDTDKSIGYYKAKFWIADKLEITTDYELTKVTYSKSEENGYCDIYVGDKLSPSEIARKVKLKHLLWLHCAYLMQDVLVRSRNRAHLISDVEEVHAKYKNYCVLRIESTPNSKWKLFTCSQDIYKDLHFICKQCETPEQLNSLVENAQTESTNKE